MFQAIRNFPKKEALSLFAFGIGMCAAASTFASDSYPKNELEGSTNARFYFGEDYDSALDFSVGYSLAISEFVQLTESTFFSTQSANTQMTVRGGFTFNLPSDSSGIRNAYYLRTLGGIRYAHIGQNGYSRDYTYFSYAAAIGKRFNLVSGLTWKPEFLMQGYTGRNQAPGFVIVPLQFSILF